MSTRFYRFAEPRAASARAVQTAFKGSLVILPLPSLDFHLSWALQLLIPASNSSLRRLHCYRSAILIIALPSGSSAFQLSFTATMADYQYGGSEEENAELRKLETELVRVARAHFTGISC